MMLVRRSLRNLFRQPFLPFVMIGLLVGTSPFVGWSWPGHPVVSSPPRTNASVDEFDQVTRPFLENYCVKCHSGNEPEAGLDLTEFDSQVAVDADLETWQEIIESVNEQFMPPSGETQPKPDELAKLKDWYQHTLVRQGVGIATRPSMRRLNRVEYENTVHDLLRMERPVFLNPDRILLVDDYFNPAARKMPRYILAMSHFSYLQKRPPLLPEVAEVPTDPSVEHGFSNDHTALSFSTLQAERYFDLANSLVNSVNFPQLCGLWESMFVLDETHPASSEPTQLARQRLESFLSRAFRRPVTIEELDRFANLFESELKLTGTYTEAMKSTVAAVLVSPSFLFRRDFSSDSFESETEKSFAIASRLSYFLWASMPDEALFQAARENRLGSDSELRDQVRRMMADKKIKSLATDFGMQWLQVAKVASARPDPDLFPFYYGSKQNSPGASMMIEQLLLFETIMVEDRDIIEFISTDFAYLNRELMDWYHLKPAEVLGYTPDAADFEDFFRVNLPNMHRGGVITSGAMLLSTSATTRTSPVYRGAWIMDVIFNRPPPPPPAAIPSLDNSAGESGEPLSVRERLQRHRADPNCAVCHDRIDPLGFALEAFNPIGQFRNRYVNGEPIDAKGRIFEENFDGAALFKLILLEKQDGFKRGFAEHMLKYALGRRLEVSDEKEIDKIVGSVNQQQQKFSAVVESVVLSDLFRSATVLDPNNTPPADAYK